MHNNNYKLCVRQQQKKNKTYELLQVRAAELVKLACGHIKVDSDSNNGGTKSSSNNNSMQVKNPRT